MIAFINYAVLCEGVTGQFTLLNRELQNPLGSIAYRYYNKLTRGIISLKSRVIWY